MSRRKYNFSTNKPVEDTKTNAEKYDEVLNSLSSIQSKRKKESLSTPSSINPSTIVMGTVLVVIIGMVLLSFGNLSPTTTTGPIETDTKLSEGLDFKIQLLDGSEVMLSDYAGEPIILDLFATWCGPCITQISHLKTVRSQYPNVNILSISVDLTDSIAMLNTFKSDNGMNWVVGRDITQQGSSIYQATSIPTMAFFDSSGALKHWEQGVTDSTTLINWIKGG
jgi:thiol-disulfide isomerase/thioredoxin